MMGEFKIHHHVSELLEVLGVKSISAEQLSEKLTKSTSLSVSSQSGISDALNSLAEQCNNPEEFINKYKELKLKNVSNLDSFVVLLDAISKDKKTKDALESFTKHKMKDDFSPISPTCTSTGFLSELEQSSNIKLSAKEISEFRMKLMESSKKPQHPTSNIIKNILCSEKLSLSFDVPPLPAWLERPYLSMDYVHSDQNENTLGPLGEVGVSTQENQLVEDLLFLMSGCRATYITITSHGNYETPPKFTIDSSVDPSLKALANGILPLCQHNCQVTRFVEKWSEYEYGMINQALTAAMNQLLSDFMLLVTQLETHHKKGDLTLNKLWYFVEKKVQMMEILACVATTVAKSNSRGGAVLSLLHERSLNLTGADELQELMAYLTQAASIPYMKQLSFWIFRGIIKDPYIEFMVMDKSETMKLEDNGKTDKEVTDDYWNKRYSLHVSNIPSFLQSHADLILRTGKYLNVVRDSDPTFTCPHQGDLAYSLRDESYTDIIEKTYKFASARLLQLLIKEKDLMGRLRSIKHYFLLDQGDFVAQLLGLCENELSKNIDDVYPSRLSSLLELALRTSAAKVHAYNDDVHCTLKPYSLMCELLQILSIETEEENAMRNLQQEKLMMTGLRGFTLAYNVEWPLSLVIDQKSQFCYQILFRHLFFCKHVERLLCRVWVTNKVLKTKFGPTSCCTALILRQRMLLFIQNLEYYMNFEVIERNWSNFNIKMQKVESVDEVLKFHSDFINRCLNDCMLTTPDLLKTVTSLIEICEDFSNFVLAPQDKEFCFDENVCTYDREFNELLVKLVKDISDMGKENYNDALIHLLYRLDFNKYYTKKTETISWHSSSENSIDTLIDGLAA